MSVVNGQIANQTTFNNAFMSRTAADTQTIAKVALENPDVESGSSIANAQRAINKAFEGIGSTGEADTTINDYANQNYILNGDSRKTAIEKLDAQSAVFQSDLNAAEVSITDHETRLDTLEPIVTDHETRLDAAEITIADHETRIDTLETTAIDHETRIDTLETIAIDHETRIDDLESAPTGGGGGGTLLWEKTGDLSPQSETVDGMKLETFSNGNDQELYALITVPSSYQAGQPIKLLSGAFFISVTVGKILFQAQTALIRDGATVLGTYPNIHTSVNVEVDAPAVANTLKQVGDIDLTNGTGQINAVAVAAGDKLRVRLLRKNSSESSPANADAKLLINNFETRFTV